MKAINSMDVMLGKQLTHLRIKRGWPLKTLASHLGISIQQVQRYEKGRNKISAVLLFQLAEIFEVKVDYFNLNNHRIKKNNDYQCNLLLVSSNEIDSFLFFRLSKSFPQLNMFRINSSSYAIEFINEVAVPNKDPRPIPDIIVLDNNLVGIDALDLLKKIKRTKYLSHIPVILFITNYNKEECQKAYLLNAAAIIKKSLDEQIFENQIIEFINYWINIVILPKMTI